MNRVEQVEKWLFILDLPRLNEQEALYLADPAEKGEVCDVFADLVLICEKRYKNNYFWPDFSILGLSCPIPSKPNNYMARIFVIGIK